MRDHAYLTGFEGYVYTTDRTDTPFTQRPSAQVMLSANRSPFELVLRNGETLHASAMAVAPMVERRFVSPHGQQVGFHVMPTHPLYRHLVGVPGSGVVPIDRDAFSAWDDMLTALYEGRSTSEVVQQHFDAVVRCAAGLFTPRPLAYPAQAELIYELLVREPDVGLARMAEQFRVSGRWMSKLFHQAMGMSLRDYQTSRKHRKALEMIYSRRSLTDLAHEAGFADSPQFTRAFQRWYGQNPSFSRDRQQVGVFLPGDRRR
jgi:AraC family transcriptional regulator, arabinose operon regulatory protein